MLGEASKQKGDSQYLWDKKVFKSSLIYLARFYPLRKLVQDFHRTKINVRLKMSLKKLNKGAHPNYSWKKQLHVASL